MPKTSEQQLRDLLGEAIPDGKTEGDTMFRTSELTELLTQFGGSVEAAAWRGWMIKAGNYAALVNVNEGNAARELGELQAHAFRMADRYVGWVTTPSRGRARIGKIVRARD